jgi:hypothetical protein
MLVWTRWRRENVPDSAEDRTPVVERIPFKYWSGNLSQLTVYHTFTIVKVL